MRNALLAFIAAAMLLVVVGCRPPDATEPGEPSSNVPTLEGSTPVPATSPPGEEPVGSTPATQPTVPSEPSGEVACRVSPPVGDPVPGLPPVTEEDWALGPADAPITLIEYADFQCPGCARFEPVLQQQLEQLGDDVRYVYRHFPLSFHEKAMITAEAAEAAGAQGAFWEMHALLYERQEEWSALPTEQMPAVLSDYADELGLDVEQFDQALEEHTYQEKIEAQLADAMAMQLPGTPTFIVNERMYPFDWGLSGDALSYFIQLKLFEGAGLQYDNPPPQVLEEGNDYFAVIQTEKGDIVIDLFEDRVPVNTNSFAFLAQEDWYQGVTFHRVIEGFVAQAGDPTGSGMMGPGYQCDNEIVPDLNYDRPGMVGIANAGPNTGSSQFFITMDALPNLNGGYTIIGEVVEGMDVVQSLTLRDPQQNPNAPPGDVIEDIVIEVR